MTDMPLHGIFSEHPSPPMTRLVDRVLDCRLSAFGTVIASADLLDPLDVAALSRLRVSVTSAWDAGTTAFRCPVCRGPLYLSALGMEHAGTSGGRRAFFVHRSTVEAGSCPKATRVGADPRGVDAARFDGAEESRHHFARKLALAAMLDADPRFTDVAIERTVRVGSSRRTPDVQARFADRPLAFEVQHAAAQLTMQTARTQDYGDDGWGLVWLFDGDDLDGAFLHQWSHDIAWQQGGHIAAIDEAAFLTASRTGCAQAYLVRVVPTETGLGIRSTLMDLADVLAVVATPGTGQPLLSSDPEARALFAAVGQGDRSTMRDTIDCLTMAVGIRLTGADAEDDDLARCIAALVTLFTGRKADASGYREDDVAALLNLFLNIANCRAWTPLLDRGRVLSAVADVALTRPSTAAKLTANLAALDAAESAARIARWTPVLAHLFPRLFAESPARALPG